LASAILPPDIPQDRAQWNLALLLLGLAVIPPRTGIALEWIFDRPIVTIPPMTLGKRRLCRCESSDQGKAREEGAPKHEGISSPVTVNPV